MIKHTPGFLLTVGALMLAPAIANAMPESEPHGSVAGLIGYGFKDGANFGLGVRGGYTFQQNFYIGGTFMYHLGTSEEFSYLGVTQKSSANIYYFGVEGGYDFIVEPVIIRPYIGLGPGFGHVSASGGGIDISDTSTVFGFWFGGTVLYPINEQWFIGGDFKIPVLDGDVFPTLAFTGGLNF
jgi:hypothetical protein